MKKRTLVLLALTACFSCFNLNASCPPPDESEPIVIQDKDILHPRSIVPDCYYLDGYVYIICNNNITSISGIVTRLSDNAQWSNCCNGSTLQIAVSTDIGSYQLTFSLSDGSSYFGEYELAH